MKWEKTFEMSAPPEVVWEAFDDTTEGPKAFRRDNAYLSRGAVTMDITREEPGVALEWTETEGPHSWSMAVTFTKTDTGTSITIVRSGFGDDDDWLLAGNGRFLGWTWVLADLDIYYRTGRDPQRFYSTPFVTAGVSGYDVAAGVHVAKVWPDSPAEQAGVQPGDIVISLGGARVATVADVWNLPRVLSGKVEFGYVRGSEILSGHGVLEAA